MTNRRDGAQEEEAFGAGGAIIRTFLIADVRNYTRFTLEHGDEAAARLASAFASVTRSVVAAHGGSVIELRGDEALAVFLSSRSALRAALDLQLRCSDVPTLRDQGVGIGLDAGEAVPVESGFRGAALNLAARLCSLARPGEVLASEGVVHLTRRTEGIEYIDLGTRAFKGFNDPVGVVQVVASAIEMQTAEPDRTESSPKNPNTTQRSLPTGRFLGAFPENALVERRSELDRLTVHSDAVVAGEGRTIMLAGEPGVGKTRLAQEAMVHLLDRDFLLSAGRCYEPEQTIPFYPWLDALPALFRFCSRAVQEDARRRWPYLGLLLPDENFAPLATTDTYEDQQRLFRALTDFLHTLSVERPVALLLDDLHWADDSSLRLMLHISRNTRSSRVLLLGTYRDVEVGRRHPLEGVLRDLGRERLVERIEVKRFGQEGTTSLIAGVSGKQQVSEELASLVHRRTDGNPFFIEEVLHSLAERTDLAADEGDAGSAFVQDFEIPESVRSVIGQRLSRLTEETQALLLEASVLGQTFEFDDLQAVAGRSEEELEQALEEACLARVVRRVGGDSYSFNHALTQQALYDELTPRRRRRLHLAAGMALEQLPGVRRERRVGEIAMHFLHADDVERALTYSFLAGESARAVLAYSEAERHFRTALEMAEELGDDRRIADAQLNLGTTLSANLCPLESRKHLEKAYEAYVRLGDAEFALVSARRMANACMAGDQAQDGTNVLEKVLEKFSDAPPSSALSRAFATQARMAWGTGDFTRIVPLAEKGRRTAIEVGDESALVGADMWRYLGLSETGNLREARSLLPDLLARAERAGTENDLALVLLFSGESNLIHGDFAATDNFWQRARDLSLRLAGPKGSSFDIFNLSELAFFLGRLQDARRLIEEAREIMGTPDSSWMAKYPLINLAFVEWVEGDLSSSAKHAHEALRLAERADDLLALRHVQLLLSELAFLQGKPDEVFARMEPLLDRSGTEEEQVTRILYLIPWAQACLGRLDEADRGITQAVERARRQDHRLSLVDHLRVLGTVRAGQRRWDEARAALQEAASLAASMPYPFAQARALFERGRVEIEAGDAVQALSHLSQALTVFQDLGAAWHSAEVDALAETLRA